MEAEEIVSRIAATGLIDRIDREEGIVYFIDGFPQGDQGEEPAAMAVRHLAFLQEQLQPLGLELYDTESDHVLVYGKIRARQNAGEGVA